jgi:hypothetical protein
MSPSETILPQETSSVTASDKTMTASVNSNGVHSSGQPQN